MNENYLNETAKDYIEKYPERLSQFLNEYEANERDFIDNEIEYFENTLLDVENSESSHDGYSTTGFSNFQMAYELVRKIGLKKFFYSTNRKIEFLCNRRIDSEKAFSKPIIKNVDPKVTNSEKLSNHLLEHGFYSLDMVKNISEENQTKLIELLNSDKIPYRIAMFDYLGYLTYLEKEHFTTKKELQKNISKWFDSDKDGRTIKGNINSLYEKSSESKRYTSHLHKEKVEKDYNSLK